MSIWARGRVIVPLAAATILVAISGPAGAAEPGEKALGYVFLASAVAEQELACQRGTGLGAPDESPQGGDKFAVILWDELKQRTTTGPVRLDTGSTSTVRSVVSGTVQ